MPRPDKGVVAATPSVGGVTLAIRRGRTRPWKRWLGIGLVVLGFVSLVSLSGFLGLRYAQTSDRLDATSANLASTSETLDETRMELDRTRETLSDAEDSLAATERQRDRLQEHVATLRTSLKGVRGSLDAAEEQVKLQAGQISVLRTCLNGVATALDLVLYEDYFGAANALRSVESERNEAFALL